MPDPAALWFDNVVTGQRARIVTAPGETGGLRFVLEYVDRPRMGRHAVPPHFHPELAETFEILSGHARFLRDGREGTAEAGTVVEMPPGLTHVHPWSDSDEELRVRHTGIAPRPDLACMTASLQGLITLAGLSRDGKLNHKGLPNPLQAAVLAADTMPSTYFAGLPPAVQRAMIRGAAATGRACGYRAAYPRYGILTERGVQLA